MYLPTPSHERIVTQGQFLHGLRLVWIQSFLLLDWLLHYLPKAEERTVKFTSFPRVLALCEIQMVSSRIWTPVTDSISYDDNHYTKRPDKMHI